MAPSPRFMREQLEQLDKNALIDLVLLMQEHLDELSQRVQRLEGQVSKDSRNSSRFSTAACAINSRSNGDWHRSRHHPAALCPSLHASSPSQRVDPRCGACRGSRLARAAIRRPGGATSSPAWPGHCRGVAGLAPKIVTLTAPPTIIGAPSSGWSMSSRRWRWYWSSGGRWSWTERNDAAGCTGPHDENGGSGL